MIQNATTKPSKIAVLDDWQEYARSSADWSPLEARATLDFFSKPFSGEDEAAAALAPYDMILAMRERTPFPASLTKRLPNLRLFSVTGHRGALLDMAFMLERGITVCHTDQGPTGDATAELALGLMLAAARHIPAGIVALRDGAFQQGTRPGIVLKGKTLGVLGLGRIGSRVARYGEALEMNVQAWSQNLTAERAAAAGATHVSKEQLLATSDVISLHLVLSERTRGILGRAELAAMKPGAILVNTSRAGLVDDAAMIEAATEQRIFAAIDVFNQEPLPARHPLADQPNAILTPHFGYSTHEVMAAFYGQQVENALAYLDGKPIRTMSR